MFLKTQTIDHNQEDIGLALGLTIDAKRTCQERILFCSFANFVQVNSLFDSRDEAPKDMTTCTGDLQRCLQMISDPLEYEYTLMMYLTLQRQSLKGIALYDVLNDKNMSKEDRKKVKLIQTMLEMQSDEESEDDLKADPLNLMRRIDLVKKSHANFDTYMNMVNSKIYRQTGGDFDIDSFLSDLNLN